MAYKSGELKDTRDYFIDNLKAFLIVLVIWGHVESNLRPVGELTRLLFYPYVPYAMLCIYVGLSGEKCGEGREIPGRTLFFHALAVCLFPADELRDRPCVRAADKT